MDLPFSGACTCGSLRFRSHAEPIAMYNCHCRGCQKTGAAPYVPLLVLRAAMVEVAGDRTPPYPVPDDKHAFRSSCASCGFPLLSYSSAKPDIMMINAIALENAYWFSAVADIWTAHAQPWVHFDRHIPKVHKSPPTIGDDIV